MDVNEEGVPIKEKMVRSIAKYIHVCLYSRS